MQQQLGGLGVRICSFALQLGLGWQGGTGFVFSTVHRNCGLKSHCLVLRSGEVARFVVGQS